MGIQRTAEILKASFNELFKQKGLTGPQYNVLRILRGAGDAGLSCREIGERMVTRESDVTRMLDRIEALGLIRRERQTDDRRVVLTFITPDGLALLGELDGPVRDLNKQQLGHLSKEELAAMDRLLGKIRRK